MDRACGIDVSRDSLSATILGEGFREADKFGVGTGELARLASWLRENLCSDVVMESTGVYWAPIYAYLEEAGFKVTVANAHQVKAIPGKKTDQADSEWLAYLLRAGLIKPSHIPPRRLRELRALTRLRAELVEDETAYKNRAHKILQLCNIRLASKLTDIFGRSGMTILKAIMEGRSLDEALERCPRNLKAKRDEIKATIMGTLSQEDLLQLKLCLELIDTLEEKVKRLDIEIARLVDAGDVERLSGVPGVKEVSAAAVIAELGDPGRFPGEKEVGAYAGLVPTVRKSGRRSWYGGITKHGPRYLRRVLVQCASAALKNRGSRLRLYYLRLKAAKGHNVAIVALARKLLVIVHHLLVTGEEYVEEGLKPKRLRAIKPSQLRVPLEEALLLLDRAGMVRPGNG